jgi:hypothetical protein
MGRSAVRMSLSLAVSAVLTLVPATTALAQGSPSPTRYLYDSRPNNGNPPTYPGQAAGPGGYVVEGLGAGYCGSSTTYSETNIRNQAVSWLNANHNTIIEITPQKYCAGLSTFEGLIDRLVTYVEGHTTNASTRFGGIMLDEEPGYGFSASEIESLNSWVYNRMLQTPGISWFYTEDQPNGWSLATYDAILGNSSAAPQVYSSSMLTAVNNECSIMGNCRNMVTVGNLSSIAPWNDPTYTLPRVDGNAWCVNYSEWGGLNVGWWNGWRSQ